MFFLALDQGTSFAAATAHGSLTGAAGQASFCLGYAWSERAGRWPAALAGGVLGFVLGALGFQLAGRLPVAALVATLVVWISLTLSLMPVVPVDGAKVSFGRWDIPWRMMTGTVVVVAITQVAPAVGPRFSGVLAAFPVVTAVLTVFAHRLVGGFEANAVLRGLLLGMFSFVAFYAVLELTVERVGIVGGFSAAGAAAVATQVLGAAILSRRATRR